MEISTKQQLPGRGFFQKKLVAFVWGRIGKKPSYSTVGFDVSFPMNQWKWDLLTCLPTILNIHSGSSKKKAGAQATIDAVYLVRKPSASPGPPMIPMHPLGWCCYPTGHWSWWGIHGSNWQSTPGPGRRTQIVIAGWWMVYSHQLGIRNLTHPHIGGDECLMVIRWWHGGWWYHPIASGSHR